MGKTDETVAAVERTMCIECRKFKPDRAKISELMDSTFADRRQMIVVDKVSE